MSCVLRITINFLSETLAKVSLVPYRVEKSCAHSSVSQCDFDNFQGQLNDALAFLAANEAGVKTLMHLTEATGVLDFAVEVHGAGFQFRSFPSALVRRAGDVGLSLELSLYPAESN